MGIVAPIVTTVGTVAGIASQQAAANRQRNALAAQAAQSALEYEVQQGQLNLAREAAAQRGALESQVAQQEANIALQMQRQQSLSSALQVESARASLAQQSYSNLVNRYMGLTQALQMEGAANANVQQASEQLNAQAQQRLAASASRGQATAQEMQALQTEAEPFSQAAQALRQTGQAFNESRQQEAMALMSGNRFAQGAVDRAALQGDVMAQSRMGIIQGQTAGRVQRANATRSRAQADIQETQAGQAGRAANFLQQDAQSLMANAQLQRGATASQARLGDTILNYNRNMVDVQERLNRIAEEQALLGDIPLGLVRNQLSIQQRNLANVAELDALSGQSAAQYGNQLSAIAANRAGIQNPNYLAGLINVGNAWMPYGMQQGWFSSQPAQPSMVNPGMAGGGGWTPYMDVRPSYNNVVYG